MSRHPNTSDDRSGPANATYRISEQHAQSVLEPTQWAASLPGDTRQHPPSEPASYAADPDFQLRGGFANLMLDAASPLFGLVIRLRTLDALPNIKDVHFKVRNQIENIREEMRRHNYEPAQLQAYSYALCLFIDEAVMERPWGNNSCWSQEPLLSIFHDDLGR